jgi:hypothetical protein
LSGVDLCHIGLVAFLTVFVPVTDLSKPLEGRSESKAIAFILLALDNTMDRGRLRRRDFSLDASGVLSGAGVDEATGWSGDWGSVESVEAGCVQPTNKAAATPNKAVF